MEYFIILKISIKEKILVIPNIYFYLLFFVKKKNCVNSNKLNFQITLTEKNDVEKIMLMSVVF